MADQLRLKVDSEPTWFNKEMAIGTLLLPVVGTLIGGWIGKKRMEREQFEGRLVNDKPSSWNKDTLLGGLIGGALLTGLTWTLGATGPVGLALGATVKLAGVIAGAYIGGKAGEKRQGLDYEEAKKQHIVQHISQSVSPEVGQAVEYAMEHKKDWGKNVLEEKLLAAAQEPQRQ